MGLFDVFKNKTGKSRKTSYSSGNKYITEYKKNKKTGSVTTKMRAVPKQSKKRK